MIEGETRKSHTVAKILKILIQYHVHVILRTYVPLSGKNDLHGLINVELCSTVPSLVSCTGSPTDRDVSVKSAAVFGKSLF